MDLTSRTGIDDLAAVTWYFNPHQDPLLLDNFRDFRAAMQKVPVPVLTVELALGDAAHQLGADFGEVVRMRTPDLMWQKERLLNKGIGILLNRGYEKIVWLDPEVRFIADESWPWLIAAELERSRLCQAFSQALIHTPGSVAWPGVSGVKYFRDTGAWLDQAGLAPGWRHLTGYSPGFSGYAWAARAEVLNEVKLYDTAVTGGADQMILAASLPEEPHKDRCVLKITNAPFRKCAHCGSHKKAAGYTNHYLNWTERWSKAVSGKVGFVKQGINVINNHHADSRQGLYAKNILVRNDFRPLDDIRQGADGAWRWSSDKQGLHEDVRRHFTPPEEDG